MATPDHAVRTPSQNSTIWGLVAQLQRAAGLERDDAEAAMRRHCRKVSGQEHSSRLTVRQADRLIERLREEVSGYSQAADANRVQRRPWGRRGPGPRGDQRITARQQAVLAALFDQAGMGAQGRIAFCQRQCRRPWAQTQKDADALFEALTAMILRRVRPEDVYHRARELIGTSGLDDWERHFVEDLARQFRDLEAAGKDLRLALTTHKLRKLTEAEVHVAEREGDES